MLSKGAVSPASQHLLFIFLVTGWAGSLGGVEYLPCFLASSLHLPVLLLFSILLSFPSPGIRAILPHHKHRHRLRLLPRSPSLGLRGCCFSLQHPRAFFCSYHLVLWPGCFHLHLTWFQGLMYPLGKAPYLTLQIHGNTLL